MCLILIAYRVHPRYPLVLAANRDEFYQRPTAGAAFWPDAPYLLAGRDLVHDGTWLGITRSGRLAALTNYRDPHAVIRNAPSRGGLVSGFLQSGISSEGYLERLRADAPAYNGYNLLFGDQDALYCYSNKNGEAVKLAPGISGLSNHLLDTPWPKVVRGKESLAEVLRNDEFSREELFTILADRSQAVDEALPDTGVGLARERMLSSVFVTSERYGTRSSTVLLVDANGKVSFTERSFNGGEGAEVEIDFEIE
jgi:uncharacterized protein with NRDE domain